MKQQNAILQLGGIAAVLLVSVACGNGAQMIVQNEQGSSRQASNAKYEGPTYMKDIRPIIVEKCKSCHPGVGPGDWLDFKQVKARAELIKFKVYVNKSMPMGGTMTDEQRKLFADWVDLGAVESAPDSAPGNGGDTTQPADPAPAPSTEPAPAPSTEPTTSPVPAPTGCVTFEQLKPVIQNRCQLCHGSMAPEKNWSTYASAFLKRDRIRVMVESKAMPMGMPMPDEERALILRWVDSGAPETSCSDSTAPAPSPEPTATSTVVPDPEPTATSTVVPNPEPTATSTSAPAACAPTYEEVIKPLMMSRCQMCHAGMAPEKNWSIYESAKAKAELIKTMVLSKAMPMGMPMPDEERVLFGLWVDAKAPRTVADLNCSTPIDTTPAPTPTPTFIIENPVNDGPTEATSPYTYEKHVQPIFKNRCSACHNELSGRPNWQNFNVAIERAGRIYTKVVQERSMPMAPSFMEDSEREIIGKWVLGGTPR
ncbi:MAG: hypothetical protein NDJ89_08625 [Oligoflexia bacterium]|nr:hypothetical protein [Oligoflexia bacterium]